MEDLNSVISAEQLSDEVLAMISEQIEQRESLNDQEIIYDYVSSKFNIPKSVVISQFLKFIQDEAKSRYPGKRSGSESGYETEECSDLEAEEELASDDEDLQKSTVKLDKPKKTFVTPKIIIPRKKSAIAGVKPRQIGHARGATPEATLAPLCPECGAVASESLPERKLCRNCQLKQEKDKEVPAKVQPRKIIPQAVAKEPEAPTEAAIRIPVSAEASFVPVHGDSTSQQRPTESRIDFLARTGWTNEEALNMVEDLVENYTEHILRANVRSVYEVDLRIRKSLEAF